MSNGIRILPENYQTGRASRVFYRACSKVDNPAHFATPDSGDYKVMVVWDQTELSRLGIYVPLRKARGYRFETAEGPVVPTFNFDEVVAGHMNLVPLVIWDLLTARAEINLPAREFPMADLELYPGPNQFEQFCKRARESEFICWDLETPFSKKVDEEEGEEDPSFTILRASMALDDFKATTFPWQEPFIGLFKQVMEETENDKITWNGEEFDLPRLWHNGLSPRGRLVDAIWLWHFLQPTLPRGLGCVSTLYDRVPEWKSISSSQEAEQAELYAAMDSRQTAKNYVGVREQLRKRRIA